MVQAARSANSHSLFREAEYCVLVLDNYKNIDYFQSLIDEVVEKRKDPDVTYTGAKDLKRQMLGFLNQHGQVQTANIWCRGLVVDLAHINELRQNIADRLARENIYGVVEVHLQDREVNSPHIQFVGIEANRAEELIAELIVDLGYERSMESAMGHKYSPYYQINPSASIRSLDDELESELRKNLIEEIESQDTNFFTEMKNQRDEFMQILNSSISEAREELSKIHIVNLKRERMFYEKTNDEITEELNARINKLRRRR